MNVNLKLFIRQLTVFSVILFAIYSTLVILLPERYISEIYWAFVPFFYAVIMISRFITNSIRKGSTSVDIAFISTTVFRFILYVGILLLYSFSNPQDAVIFIITFFVFYFAFTLFEVSFMYRDLRAGNN